MLPALDAVRHKIWSIVQDKVEFFINIAFGPVDPIRDFIHMKL